MYPTSYRSYQERQIDGLTREEVCHRYQRKILLLARRISERLPPGCEIGGDDLASFGAIGLLEAFERYDENRNILFSTFAEYRIRGAMMDALRASDTFSRHRRQLSRRIQDVAHVLTLEYGRTPEPTEVADRMGMDIDTYWRAMDRVKPISYVRLEDMDGPDGEDDGRCLGETIVQNGWDDALTTLLRDEARGMLREAIESLPDRKRECVLLYYGRDMNLAEVAEVFSVTPSRISQILSEARTQLRRMLDGRLGAGDLGYKEAL